MVTAPVEGMVYRTATTCSGIFYRTASDFKAHGDVASAVCKINRTAGGACVSQGNLQLRKIEKIRHEQYWCYSKFGYFRIAPIINK